MTSKGVDRMTRPARIGADAALKDLPQWEAAQGRDAIVRNLKFADFAQAFGFMAQIALTAEKMDHHPEWSNIYNRVEVLLATHDADGVTALDVQLAQAIDAAALALGAQARSVSASKVCSSSEALAHQGRAQAASGCER